MTWSWRLETTEGRAVGMSDETFSTQADAESWLGENWRALLADGADKVTLIEGDAAVYEMSLHEPD